MDIAISDWITRWADRRPDAPALVCGERRLSYGELEQQVAIAAARLRALGVGEGDRVACLMPNRTEFLELFWATVRLGAIFAPLNTRLTAPELGYALHDLEPRVCVVDDELTGQVDRAAAADDVVHWVDAGPEGLRWEGPPPAAPPTLRLATDPDRPACILYTSGTTGFPKGAIITQGNIQQQAAGWVQAFNTGRTDRHLLFLPLCFTGGLISGAMNPVFSGATLVLQDRFEPAATLELIEAERITWFTTVPTMLERLLRHPTAAGRDLSSLRRVESGGSPVSPELIEAARARGFEVLQGYGLTECAAGPCLFLDEEDGITKAGSVGRSALTNESRIVDEHGAAVPPGEVGELTIRGGIVFAGYWRNAEATAARLQDGWLHTEDLARQDEDGYYFIVGRKAELIISGGLNVYPAEVERVIARLPGVAEAAVVGLPDADWGELVTAFVIAGGDATLSQDEVIAGCRRELAGYKVPKRVHVVAEFPRTASGKVRKHLLAPVPTAR